jgi:hypothetical protein
VRDSLKPVSAIVQTVEAEASLAELARQIAGAHADALAAAPTTVEHARRSGGLLLEVKARLPHGQFMKWVAASCPFKRSTANNYTRVAEEWEKVQETVAADEPATIAGALRSLAEPAEGNSQPAGHLPGPPEVQPPPAGPATLEDCQRLLARWWKAHPVDPLVADPDRPTLEEYDRLHDV